MDCIFCKIVSGEIPAKILFETDEVLVIENINPEAPFHALTVPKKHLELAKATEADQALLGKVFFAAKEVGASNNPKGFRLITNVGEDSNREIEHLHIHVLGGKNLGSLLPK